MKNILFILTVFFFAGCHTSQTFDVGIEEFKSEFATDHFSAIKKYRGNYVRFVGEIVESAFPKCGPSKFFDNTYFLFATLNENGGYAFPNNQRICCYFKEFIGPDYNKGETVTIKGEVTEYKRHMGKAGTILLRHCKVLARNGVPAEDAK